MRRWVKFMAFGNAKFIEQLIEDHLETLEFLKDKFEPKAFLLTPLPPKIESVN